MPLFPRFIPPEQLSLKKSETWPDAVHVFDPKSIWAIRAALACRRPLLVRGEPGIGKSQLARAAAAVLGWPFLYHVVHARTEPDDLLFSFDAVGRLAQAQIQRDATQLEQLDAARFVRPGPFWWAIDWRTAEARHEIFQKATGGSRGVATQKSDGAAADTSPKPSALPRNSTSPVATTPFRKPEGWTHGEGQGCVLLVDEIDKAESDLPNALLESLGNCGFQVPLLGASIQVPENCQPPLVVFTTNEDRDLPPAFLRRCLVLNLEWDEKEWATKAVDRALAHLEFEAEKKKKEKPKVSRKQLEDLAKKFLAQRTAIGKSPGFWRPGAAEFIDLAVTLENLEQAEGTASLSMVAKDVEEFFVQKNPKSS